MITRGDGSEAIILSSSSPLRDGQGDITGAVITFYDVTARRRMERALQESLQRLYSILAHLYGSILLVSDEDKVEFANQSFCELFALNVSPQALVGVTAAEMIELISGGYQDGEESVARIRQIVRRGEPVRDEQVALRQWAHLPAGLHSHSSGREGLWKALASHRRHGTQAGGGGAAAGARTLEPAPRQFTVGHGRVGRGLPHHPLGGRGGAGVRVDGGGGAGQAHRRAALGV